MERETGIEPATNSLEGCDSTIELLPPGSALFYCRKFDLGRSNMPAGTLILTLATDDDRFRRILQRMGTHAGEPRLRVHV
jgi:hypothetical protein